MDEKDFAEVATKEMNGDKVGAISALAGLVTTLLTGHPLVGSLLSGGSELLARAMLNSATKRMQIAEAAWNTDQERIVALQRMLQKTVEPFDTSTREISQQLSEQFLQTLRYLDRNVASAEGQQQVARDVREVLAVVKAKVRRFNVGTSDLILDGSGESGCKHLLLEGRVWHPRTMARRKIT